MQSSFDLLTNVETLGYSQGAIEAFGYIDGRSCKGSCKKPIVNPATEKIEGHLYYTDREDIDRAIAAAQRSQSGWASLSRIGRAEYLNEILSVIKNLCSAFVELMVLETGKSYNEANAEFVESVHMCESAIALSRQPFGKVYASESSGKDVQIVRKPRGVIAVISPWNFPLAIGSFWCSIPALLEGNTVVHKPSELTPMVASLAAEAFKRLPKGVYNLIHGDATQGEALFKSDVDVVLFTGSAEVGRKIRMHCAEGYGKVCSCETGSKSAMIICEDYEPNLAIDACIASCFKLTGQRCVSASRILVHRKVMNEFCDTFVAAAKRLTFGPPTIEKSCFAGPLISKSHRQRVMQYNDLVRQSDSATILLDYNVPDTKGWFITPFIYIHEWCDAPFLKQEVFGPHVAIVPFDSLDDAINIYNDTEYGLSVGVISKDFRVHRRIRNECRAGMVYVNGGCIGAESHLPFGGVGKSGSGWKSAVGTVEAVTYETVVTTNHEEAVSFAQGLTI